MGYILIPLTRGHFCGERGHSKQQGVELPCVGPVMGMYLVAGTRIGNAPLSRCICKSDNIQVFTGKKNTMVHTYQYVLMCISIFHLFSNLLTCASRPSGIRCQECEIILVPARDVMI